ncbi:hypothetical protein E2C01_010907 [Portunus trituberculatus]|uniref:Uncharacterized protein n=1 Tax=Portunus trituberculatus TaxID=210409 RepID=A0A5B7DA44_PORTR|nr:hypothetical protein [Portunus trituberculatus]
MQNISTGEEGIDRSWGDSRRVAAAAGGWRAPKRIGRLKGARRAVFGVGMRVRDEASTTHGFLFESLYQFVLADH